MAPFQKDERFFTHDWTITLPSHPQQDLKFIRLTPADTEAFLHFAEGAVDPSDPDSTSAPPNEPSASSEVSRVPIRGERMKQMYAESSLRHHALDVFMSLENQFVGWGGIYQITPPDEKPSLANIGIKLSPEVRGKGLGKVLMQVLLRLSNEIETDVIEAGTMKWNKGMRALARSLGLVEAEELKVVPGRGVVADLLFKDIERERWAGLEMVVEFREKVGSV
jgi:RimJ/RimL family protein N-acetyltransferase